MTEPPAVELTVSPSEVLGRGAVPITDAARRAVEAMTEACIAGLEGAWLAIRLSDGRTDGKVYELRADAVRFQLHEHQCMYLAVPPVPPTELEMQIALNVHRKIYDDGRFSLVDPQEEREQHASARRN